ncbi:MAG: ABC transporter permease [Dehalococcoidia bacterium]|nr:ABC transporter permease [Dehalococcoidia bacterium]
MNRALAIANRIVRQFLRDRRTLGMLLLVPILVMTLVGFSFPRGGNVLDYVAPALLAAMALFFVFILTGVSFLRERSQGTLERLMASPVSRAEIIVGYLLGFILFAAAQAVIILLYTVFVLQVHYVGALWQIFVFQLIITVVALNLGLFVSTYARNELQVIQFIPLVLVPQFFLSGLLYPVEQMNQVLQYISKVMPLTYAVEGLRKIMLDGRNLGDVWKDLVVLMAWAIAMTVLGALALRRGSPS